MILLIACDSDELSNPEEIMNVAENSMSITKQEQKESDEIEILEQSESLNITEISDIIIEALINEDMEVEYYNEGTEQYAGLDWSSVLFVYEENEQNEFFTRCNYS